jgi:hypothetical protein
MYLNVHKHVTQEEMEMKIDMHMKVDMNGHGNIDWVTNISSPSYSFTM